MPIKTFISLSIVIFAAVMSIGTHFTVEALDRATAQQCKTHAWPSDQATHYIHMDWCTDNGYPTNGVSGVSRGIESPTQLLPPAEMGTAQQENPVDYTPVGQVIAPYVSLAAIFIAAIVIGYVTDGSVQAGDQVQTLVQSLPPVEIGTAHTTERHERLQHRNS